LDPSVVINQIIYAVSSAAVGLSIPVVAIAILIVLQRRREIRGFKFFIMGFFSQIVSIIIGAILSVLPWLVSSNIPSIDVFQVASTIHRGTAISLYSLSYLFLSLGFLSLLGYKVQINGLAIVSAVLSAVSMFVPWFAANTKLIALTYTFPLGLSSGSYLEQWVLMIVTTLLTIAIYCFVFGSVFNGRIGRMLILAGGILASVSPFTYFLVFESMTPWIGLFMPFTSTMVAYFAFQYHPKEMERTMPDLTGLTTS